MISNDALQSCYTQIRGEAQRLAGDINDLSQRATVYHHLFEHSGKNHAFPLIAAHGALWARGYFQFGMKLGQVCSLQYALSPEKRAAKLAALNDFADAFRDINRRVCVETYSSYHFTRKYGEHPDAVKFVPIELLTELNRCHHARRQGLELSDSEKRNVFLAFFLNEQETVVGPSIEACTSAFDWPVMKFLALRPAIRFAYFGDDWFWFRNFANKQERIERGLRAFDIAAELGWDKVVAALRQYKVLPAAFFTGSARHFASVREEVLAAA